jgi:peroxiredoxin
MPDEISRFSRCTAKHKALPAAIVFLFLAAPCFFPTLCAGAQGKPPAWSREQKPIVKRLRSLRSLPDEARGRVTRQLALRIRQLPPSASKVRLATALATLSTEGDPGGAETLQEVTATLAGALRQSPPPATTGQPSTPYVELATLVRYEHMQASLDSPEFAAALSQLKKQDEQRQQAAFTLQDLRGKSWRLKALRGKVALVNFWATWCPPCRKEIPDLEALYKRFSGRGLVVLGISDEKASTVQPFVRNHRVTYPILLDPGRKVHKLFSVEGIPMTFLYGRDGKLVAEAADMRTREQFLAMLAKAGLR